MEQRIHPDKKIKPAGIFYYAMKDPIVDQEAWGERRRAGKTDFERAASKMVLSMQKVKW